MTRRKNHRREAVASPTCPYCGKPAEYTPTSGEVYHGHDYGPLWICRPCQAWVGCHRETKQPLGRLADSALRKAKIAAHAAFDPLWKSGTMTRSEAYWWLAKALNLAEPPHMGFMNIDECRSVISAVDRFRASR